MDEHDHEGNAFEETKKDDKKDVIQEDMTEEGGKTNEASNGWQRLEEVTISAPPEAFWDILVDTSILKIGLICFGNSR